MAKAVSDIKQIPVTTYTEESVIILTLSQEEAQFIYDVTQRIGGDMERSRRKYAEAIDQELSALGFTPKTDDISREQRAIYFTPTL